MKKFLQRFGSKVSGVLSGFDRLRFRGTKRLLANARGMMQFLWQMQILLKDFSAYAKDTTGQLCTAIERQAQEIGRPVQYLNNCQTSKEEEALRQAQERGITQGLLGVLSCVEPCLTAFVRGDRASRRLELKIEQGKCLHYYHYYLDAQYGLCYTRLQTWFPFTMHIGINGREWLAQQLNAAGIDYVKKDNCFVQVSDYVQAQQLLDQQLRTDWPQVLEELAARNNPLHERLLAHAVPYYWSAQESEWATDIVFRRPADLAVLYPRLAKHAIEVFGSGDVMRFLGYKVTAQGRPHGQFAGEVVSTLKERHEGVCVKHRVGRNSVKMYDKQGADLRVEPLIIDTRDFKVFRTKEGDDEGDPQWLRLRKGVADLHRRAEISQQITNRYVDALAAVDDQHTLAELTQEVCQRVPWHGRRCRALNPLAPADVQLLETVIRGEFLINGFRNRDLRALWFGTAEPSGAEQRRQSAAVTRKLRLLRAHGLIRKVSKTHRYMVTEKGQTVITAVLAARNASPSQLTQVA